MSARKSPRQPRQAAQGHKTKHPDTIITTSGSEAQGLRFCLEPFPYCGPISMPDRACLWCIYFMANRARGWVHPECRFTGFFTSPGACCDFYTEVAA
jgi:hypothetical protein